MSITVDAEKQRNSESRHSIYHSGTLLPLLFFCLFFIISGFVGIRSIKVIEEYQDDVNTSLENIYLIDQLYIEILRAESGQRGYLITELNSYLEPYTEALSVVDSKLDSLHQAGFDAVQLTRLSDMEILISDKLNEMAGTVENVISNRELQAVQEIFTHRGRNLMREISEILSVMENHERSILNTRVAQTRSSRATALLSLLTANLVGIVMVFVTWSLIRSSLKKEQEYTENLTLANASLEARVEERTDELKRYSMELKRSNRELQDFAFVASHDLQEPLRKIRAFGDRIESQYGEALGEKGKDYLTRMQDASERMSLLISDLLSFSRITSQKKPFKTINLNQILLEVLNDLEIAIHESDASVNCDTLPEIEGDKTQMRQLLQNLIGNALKFKHKDKKPVIAVKVSSINEDEFSFSVSDNGIGFNSEFADKIFMPFQRLHGRNEYKGAGIGLAICRRIVERHGGTIHATSDEGVGASFHIKLPLQHIEVVDVSTVVKN